MFAEPVTEPTPCFANVRHGACTTSEDINDVTGRAREPLSYCQRSTRGVDLGGWIGMGAGPASAIHGKFQELEFKLSGQILIKGNKFLFELELSREFELSEFKVNQVKKTEK